MDPLPSSQDKDEQSSQEAPTIDSTPATLISESGATGGDVATLELTALARTFSPQEVPTDTIDEIKTEHLSTGNNNRFHVRSELGRGGMGAVFRVHDLDLDRDVAFKTLHGTPDSGTESRFIRECRITGQLEHPNIIPIHDVGTDASGNLYLSMRLIEGETLRALIERLRQGDSKAHQEFTINRRLELFLKILAAMDLAHSRGIIHRDLKPENIMLGPFDEIFVLDWGIASTFSGDKSASDNRLTKEGTFMGTPKFMSPEQAAGQIQEMDQRSDIYSLCAILYELITLEHYLGLDPSETSVVSVVQAVLSKAPDSPESVRHKSQNVVSRWLSLTILKGLNKKPADRHQSVKELAKEIRLFIDGKRSPVSPHTAIQRVNNELSLFMDVFPTLSPFLAFGTFLVFAFGVYSLFQVLLSLQ